MKQQPTEGKVIKFISGKLIPKLLYLSALALLVSGCAVRESPSSAESFSQERSARRIALLPVALKERFDIPYGIDIEGELRAKVTEVLREKGYEVIIAPDVDSAGDADAAMAVIVEELFYDVTDNTSIHFISIFAAAELKSPSGESLWQDEAISRLEGISYEFPERLRLLTVLAERLLDTLPEAK